jgi:flagellar protein FlaJ
MSKLYRTLARIYPNPYKNRFAKMMIFAGMTEDANLYLGKALVYSTMAFFATLAISSLFGYILYGAIIGLVLAVLIQFLSYTKAFFRMDARTKKAEASLPDALQLMASNLRAGMTPYQAMVLAKRKDFGPIEEEFSYATTKALGNESFTQVLLNIGKRINSATLERAMKLIISSLKSGGHLANLLEELARDISETRSLRNEIITNTRTYTMFILFAVIFGAPLLFSISIHFVGVVNNMQAKSNIATSDFGLGLLIGQLDITPEFLGQVSVVTLTVTSFLACFLIGVISQGKGKYGLKYAPILIGGSLLMFFVARVVVSSLFTSLIG